jgi:hypothetical protein
VDDQDGACRLLEQRAHPLGSNQRSRTAPACDSRVATRARCQLQEKCKDGSGPAFLDGPRWLFLAFSCI